MQNDSPRRPNFNVNAQSHGLTDFGFKFDRWRDHLLLLGRLLLRGLLDHLQVSHGVTDFGFKFDRWRDHLLLLGRLLLRGLLDHLQVAARRKGRRVCGLPDVPISNNLQK